MPRIARVAAGGIVQHVLNRANGRMKLFRKPQDCQAFVNLLGEALDRVPGVSLLGWCLMPNHWPWNSLTCPSTSTGQAAAVPRPAGPPGELDVAGQPAAGRR